MNADESHRPRLSALVVAHNEAARLPACLERLKFAGEIVVVLDKCTDNTGEVAEKYGARTVPGSWKREGGRRNAGIAACRGDWILEVDADEHVSGELAREIEQTIATTAADWHEIPVDNYVGGRRVRYGAGASFTKAACPALFKNGVKTWGEQRVHPALQWSGKKGAMLSVPLDHYVDNDISDMIRRLNSYSTLRAQDLVEAGDLGSFLNNLRRLFSRFFKCYLKRKGYREGLYGFLFALFAGLFPLLSYFKARGAQWQKF